MERDPEIRRNELGRSADGWDDAGTKWKASSPPCPGIPSTPHEAAESRARGMGDIAAGRVYPHSLVKQWLRTWGSPTYLPFQDWLAARNG